jgi:hypothetical protein
MANIEDAIKAINPDAQFRCKPANSTAGITWENGTSPISAEDLEAKKTELTQAEADEKTAADAKKASGKAKLKAGEALNDAELSALFGA